MKPELTSREKRVLQLKREAYKLKRASTHPMELEAGNIVYWAKKYGIIQEAKSCSECGIIGARLEYHHDDYEFPLAVRALCSACHKAWHKENEPLNASLVQINAYKHVIPRWMFGSWI